MFSQVRCVEHDKAITAQDAIFGHYDCDVRVWCERHSKWENVDNWSEEAHSVREN